VIQPPGGEDWRGFTGEGTAVNSGPFDSLPTAEFKKRITAWLAKLPAMARGGKVNDIDGVRIEIGGFGTVADEQRARADACFDRGLAFAAASRRS
jgi:hypothetical protein